MQKEKMNQIKVDDVQTTHSPTNDQRIALRCCATRNDANGNVMDVGQHRDRLQEKRQQLRNLKQKITQLMAINARLQTELKKLKTINLKRKRATFLILRYLDHNFSQQKRSLQFIRHKVKILYKSLSYKYLLLQGFGLPATERILFKRILKVFKNHV